MSKFINFVNKMYSPKYLFYTNTATGLVFLAGGDFMVQKFDQLISDDKRPFDVKRNLCMVGAGTYFGGIGHLWYSFLDRKFPGHHVINVKKKLLCEVIIGPPFGGSVFFVTGMLEGKSFKKIYADFKANILLLCAFDWGFYVPLQIINFRYLPPKYRFLYVATISLVYDVFLAYILHRNDEPKPFNNKNK